MLPKNTSVNSDAGHVGALAQHAELDQRGPSGAQPGALLERRRRRASAPRRRARRRSRSASPGCVRRPAGRPAGSSRRPAAAVPTTSSRRPCVRGGAVGQDLAAEDEREDAQRQVDQEQRPPVGAEQVRLHQQPGDDRAEHRGEPDHRAERGERLADVLAAGTGRGSARRSAAPSPPPRVPGRRAQRRARRPTRRTSRTPRRARSRPARAAASACGRTCRRAGRRPSGRPPAPGCTPPPPTRATTWTSPGRAWMAGAATLTIVESRMFRIIAARTTAKPGHIRRGAVGVSSTRRTVGTGGRSVVR